MKIANRQSVRRFLVVFDRRESDALRSIGHLPPHSAGEAPAWLTRREALDAAILIDEMAPSLDAVSAMIRLLDAEG